MSCFLLVFACNVFLATAHELSTELAKSWQDAIVQTEGILQKGCGEECIKVGARLACSSASGMQVRLIWMTTGLSQFIGSTRASKCHGSCMHAVLVWLRWDRVWLLGGFRRPRIAIDCRSCVTTGWQNIEFCRLSIAVDMVCCRIGEVNFATRLHDSFMKSTSKLRSETKSATRQRMTLSPKMKSSGMVAWKMMPLILGRIDVICYEIPLAIRKHCAPSMASLPTSFSQHVLVRTLRRVRNSVSLCRCSYMRKGMQLAYQGVNVVVHSESES